MTTATPWNVVWERARKGTHTMIIGQDPVPLAPGDLQMFWICCETTWTTGGPIGEALRRLGRLLGEDLVPTTEEPESHGAGLPSQLFGDRPARSLEARFVEAGNRLAAWSGCNVVLGFASLDAADEATIMTLMHILRHPEWLHLPLIVTVQRAVPGLISELLEIMRLTSGDDAIIEMGIRPQQIAPPVPFNWAALPPDVLRVLRAGSVIGQEFSAELVAKLLDEPVGVILETLQRAADAGVTLADLGESRFSLTREAIESLQSHMLPSLLTFWHAKAGSLLSEEPPSRHKASQSEPLPEMAVNAPEVEPPVRSKTDDKQIHPRTVPEEAPTQTASEPPRVEDYTQLFEVAPVPDASTSSSPTPHPIAEQIADHSQRPLMVIQREGNQQRSSQPETDQVKAADHFHAAGQTEAAATQYLNAAQALAVQGDARRASVMVQQGLSLLDRLPPSEPRSLLRAQLLLLLGNMQWQSATLGMQGTLQDALLSLDAAKAELPESAPLEIVGRLAALTAGVCCDLGALVPLQRALGELATVSRRWLEAGVPLQAACLLNDQAAIYVRLVDPVRAAHLLQQSRELFERVLRIKPDDGVALAALATTHHLLARLPLHTQIRPGREADAYTISFDHALMAESVYERLGQPRALARVWETMGRLELRRGRLEAAEGRLLTALQLQKQLGDITGLARTTGALAELYIASKQLNEAARLLEDSVELNFEKGSPIGLGFNRRVLEMLQQAVNETQPMDATPLRDTLEEVEHRLTQAEAILGQLTVIS